ncbi:MAG: 4Fe-4S cluster-binding domain-containing protein, partial [Acetanaerobacterium sp.]
MENEFLIHKYSLNGYNIVLDVHSGAVHIVDKVTYDVLDHIAPPLQAGCPEAVFTGLEGKYSREALEESYQELLALYEGGTLFSPDDYEQFHDMMNGSPVKAMCLHIAHDCNLRCSYCFASTGDFGKGRKLMPAEIGKQAIDFLIAHSGNRHNLEVDLFGGEPLMNFDVVMQIVDYARSREKECDKLFRFTATTNGMLLSDDKIDYLNREMNNIVLSIDGRKDVNDRMRKRVDGSGSYDTIVPKYQRLVQRRGQ